MVQTICKQLAVPLICAAAAGGGAPPAGAQPGPKASPAKSALTVGISDNSAAMFSESQYQSLHSTTARDMVFWNIAVMKNKKYLKATRQWVNAAVADGVNPMISFAGNGNYIPSVSVYTKAIRAFIKMFPQVKTYTPWNEPDWIYRPALAKHPSLAAGYFNALAKYCHRCTVAAGDVYLPSNQGLASWVRAYARSLHHRPAAWALHPYDDIRAHQTKQIQAFESVTRGPIWLTEISGVERRGHWGFKNQNQNHANKDERFLFALPKRFHRITRIYHYQWQGTPSAPWDSGLLGPQGRPRPAYYTVRSATQGHLP
ncbi:MAG TPA: glycosyl hydrolase [Solirubrobacteraceae bacterium]|jgi:hypothetical protein